MNKKDWSISEVFWLFQLMGAIPNCCDSPRIRLSTQERDFREIRLEGENSEVKEGNEVGGSA